MTFTLRQLRYFKALAEQRNFGRAAAVSHVSQPALSVQIRALEAAMGGALVERRSRDVVLTALGREVLAHTSEILGATERLARVAQDHDKGRRALALGLIPTLAPYLLPGVLAALRAGDLSLSVQVREARTAQLITSLQSGDLDAAVLALPVSVPGLEEVPLFEDRFLLAGSRSRVDGLLDRVDAPIRTLRPSDLNAAQLMLLEDGHCLTDQALEVCGMDRTGPGINMGASSLGTLSRLVAAGFGLTLMPELAAEAESSAAPDLCLRRFCAPEPRRVVGLVRRSSTTEDRWFEDLADLIRDVGSEIVGRSRQAPQV